MADFRVDDRYELTPDALHRLLTDGAFVAAKFGAIGFTDVEVPEATPGRLEVVRTTEPTLPGWAKPVAGKQRITEVQVWRTAAPAGPMEADFTVRTSGAPVTITGSLVLDPDGAGTVLRVRGTVKAKVPLIGGKIADLVASEAVRNLEREYAFTRAWIADH